MRALLPTRTIFVNTSKLQRRIGVCRVATLQPPTTAHPLKQPVPEQAIESQTQMVVDVCEEEEVLVQETFPNAKVSPQVLMELLDKGNLEDTQLLLSCKQRRLKVIYSEEIANCVDSLEIADVLFLLYDRYGMNKRLHKEEVIDLRNYIKFILCTHGAQMHEVIYNIIVDILIYHKAIDHDTSEGM